MAAKVDSRGGTRPTKVTFNKPGTVPNVGSFSQTNDESHEMHIKMSKKIAQLTKVIFTLNTKNEDFEEIIEGLKSTHNNELQRVNLEYKDKIVHYKQKLELVKEQETLINKLQCLLEDERKDKHHILADFGRYKEESSENRNEIRTRYEEKMNELVGNLTTLKSEFELRTQQFQSSRKKLENEKNEVLSNLTHQHTIEMEKLIKAHRVRYDEIENEKLRLQEEISSMRSERTSDLSSKDTEMRLMVEENEVKCEKLKIFYQKELSAAKEKQEMEYREKLEKFKNEERILQASLKGNEEALRKRIRTLNDTNETLESKLAELETAVSLANKELNKSHEKNDKYSKENSNLQQELSVSGLRLKGVQNELNSLKTRYDQQLKDLLKKSGDIGSLEATKLANSSTIKDLTLQIDELKARCNELESERKNLGRKLSASSSESHSQIKNLQQDLEKLEEDRKRALTQLEKERKIYDTAYEKKVREMKEEKDFECSNLIANHKKDIMDMETSHKEDMESIREAMKNEQNEIISRLEVEKKEISDEKVKEIVMLETRLKQYESEVLRLNDAVQEGNSKNASSSDELLSCQRKIDELQTDLDETRAQLKSTEEKLSNLEDESEARKDKHTREIENAALKLKDSLKELQTELDQQWTVRMRDECENIRETVLAQQREENDAAVSHVLTLKEKELEAYKKEMQQQISRYQQQVSRLRQDLQNASKENAELLRTNTEAINELRAKYEDDIAKMKFEHSGEIEVSYLENEKRLKSLTEKYDLDLKNLAEKLNCEHQEALSGVLMANRAAIDAIKHEAETLRKDQSDELNKQHSEDKEQLRQSLFEHHQVEFEKQRLHFQDEIEFITDELKKMKELRSKESAIHNAKVEELSDLMNAKDEQMNELSRRIEELETNVKVLARELEGKVEEIRRVRREANINIRRREQQLAKEHQNEVDELTADNLRETQRILAEFNKAKELLKDKIEALQLLLDQAEARYRNRESRPEDLETIESLRTTVSERELECHKLMEEKRFFQLELLNRETNFNKIFNSMPNVGVINPLEAGKKRRKAAKDNWNLSGRAVQRQSSGSSSPAKLEPLQHPKIHDQRLNNSKPLPNAPLTGV